MSKNIHLSYLAAELLSFFFIFIFFYFQLILELCKGSGRGSQNSQVIQSYLEKLPLSTASADVSASGADRKTFFYFYFFLNKP